MLKTKYHHVCKITEHYRHQLPIAQHRVKLADAEALRARKEAEAYQYALDGALRIEGDTVLRILTCGLSHRAALKIIQGARC